MQHVDTPTLPASPARRLALAGAASLALAASAILAAPSAQAHDGLIGTEPNNGMEVGEAPESATLRFSGELKNIGSQVRVTDEDGTAVESTPSVQGRTLEVAFDEELPDGEYTITWRVVSSDGHPIEGTTANGQALRFAVQKAEATSATASPSRSSTPATSSAPTPATSAAAASSPESSQTGVAAEPSQNAASSPLPWLAAGAVVLMAAAVYIITRARRKRH